MKNLILIGGGGHCKSVIDVIETENKYNILGIIDVKEKIGQNVLGYKIIDCDENIVKYVNNQTSFLITIGQIESPNLRIKLFNKLKELKADVATVVSPFAYVSKHSIIEEGTIVAHGAIINANAKVGKNCIINSKALLEHDTAVEDNCHISTGAILNGEVKIGKNSFIGSHATIVQCVNLKPDSFIKAHELVKKNN